MSAIIRDRREAEVVNVYGPKASGKTRNKDRLQAHYRCKSVIDGGNHPFGEPFHFKGAGPHLLLTETPVRAHGVRNIPISVALSSIGGMR